MCNPAQHPIWRVVAKRAHTSPVVVWGIVSYLQHPDPIMALLTPQDRAQMLADWSGLKPLQVALVLASLEHSRIIVDGQITVEWSDILRQSDDLKTDLKIANEAARRARRAAVNRRYYLKRKAKLAAPEADPATEFKTSGVSYDRAAFLEEGKEQPSLFPSGAREQADIRPAKGWGVQAEDDKQAKANRWRENTLRYAEKIMSFDAYKRLAIAACQDPRPKWAQQELDELSRRMKAGHGTGPPDRRQPHMPLPIPGGRADPRVEADLAIRQAIQRGMAGRVAGG